MTAWRVSAWRVSAKGINAAESCLLEVLHPIDNGSIFSRITKSSGETIY